MEIVINARNLSKDYKLYHCPQDRVKEAMHPLRKKYHWEFHALKDVSFSIARGEIVGIVGKNGSGKSTLLKILAGVLNPSSGTVQTNGRISALLELGTGFNPEYSGLENIYYNGTIMGFTRQDVDKKVDEIVAFADIGEFIYQPVKMYSSGMFARLAFAVAINVNPEVFIVDEALSVGDAAFQRKCFAKMEKIKEQGTTILFVSHSETAIINLCTRALLFNQGELVMDASPKQIVHNYLRLLSCSGEEQNNLVSSWKANASVSEECGDYSHSLSAAIDNLKQTSACACSDSLDGLTEEYLPSLAPLSTTQYESKGIVLKNPSITTLDGKKVNILLHGRRYVYSYEAQAFTDSYKVHFSMLFKTIEGVHLGGGSFPTAAKAIEFLPAGKKLIVRWEFECVLEDGTYCTNCGVVSVINGMSDYSHRILDAYLFKVISVPDRITTGYVDFNLAPSIELSDD